MIEVQDTMPDLPKGWAWCKIGEVGELVRGVSYKKNEASTEPKEGYVAVLRANNINYELNLDDLVYVPGERVKDEQFVRTDDIVICMSSGSKHLVGKAARAKNDLPAGFGAFCGLVRVSEQLHKRYVGYFFQSSDYRNAVSRLSIGVNINNLRRDHIESMPIPLAPLAEQERIVGKIEEFLTQLDAGVAALEKAKAQLQRYRQAVLKAAMEGELTKEWREAHQGELEPASVLLARIRKERESTGEKLRESPPLDTSVLPALPEGWAWATLPQLGEMNRGRSRHRPRNDAELYGGQYPFIQTGDVRQADGRIRHYSQTYSEEGLKQSRLWPAGTLCITIAANIAETAFLGFDACFPDSIVGFLTDPSCCDARFVEFFFRMAREDIEQYAPATAQKNINLRILSALGIPLPSLREQRLLADEIERLLSVAAELEKAVEDSAKRADSLRQSILKRAFEGKLVAQDPADEPACVLVGRIRAQKEGAQRRPAGLGRPRRKQGTAA